ARPAAGSFLLLFIRRIVGGAVPYYLREAIFVLRFKMQTFLQDRSDVFPELEKIRRPFFLTIFNHRENLADHLLLEHADDARILKRFAGDIEGEVFRINNSSNKPEPLGQKLIAALHG